MMLPHFHMFIFLPIYAIYAQAALLSIEVYFQNFNSQSKLISCSNEFIKEAITNTSKYLNARFVSSAALVF